MTGGRLIGVLLLGAALLACLIGSAVMLPRFFVGQVDAVALTLGLALVAVIVLPLAAGGVYMLVRGGQEAKSDVVAQKQRRLLDMVTTRGELPISDAAVELQMPREEVKNWVYRLVGLGVFTGYINWEDGVLYSAQASQLRDMTHCKKCGGEVKLVGKGVVRCPYCGTEYFLD